MERTKSNNVLSRLWKNAPNNSKWGYSFFPARGARIAEMYVTSPDGKCWKIIAQEHIHDEEN